MQSRDDRFIDMDSHAIPTQPAARPQFGIHDKPKLRAQVYNVAILLYSLTIFSIDLLQHRGIAAGVPYLFAVWIAYYAPRISTLWITAGGCSALTILGALFSVPSIETHVVVINRLLSLTAIWGTALLCRQTRIAREELAERGQQVRAIIEHSPTAMLMTDADGRITLTNSETLRLLGYEQNELIGQPVEVLIPEAMRTRHPGLRAGFINHPSARSMGGGRDLHALRKDGSEVAVEIGLTPIRHGETTYVLSSIVDISWRKALEADLRTMNNELEQRVEDRTAKLQISNDALVRSNTELQQFAYIASHDLQTPLRSISGFVQLLADGYGDKLDPEARDWIKRTVDNTQRMHTLINDLLSYSRIDSRARPFSSVDLNELLRETEQLFEDDLKAVDGKITHDHLPTVLGDASQLTQLLANLIGNALKYHDKRPPQIHISAHIEGDQWIIRVRDNGIGIDPKHHDSIFDIFKRLHTNQTYPGTGIGLAVCRRVVHRHGGRIWVESNPGYGSTFVFTLAGKEQ